MLGKLGQWLDHRTGYRKIVEALLIENIPGGAKWRYVWGSCLAFVFIVQLITGILLMTAYSPGDSTAWSSVYYIQYEMDFGWLIRGLHHFGSQTMVVLLGIHMLQVAIAGAHLPPREVNWWLGIGLLGLVLALSLTGYLLPWDQKGYWATQVSTNIAGSLPVLGTWIQKIIVGGPVYGHHTLTRFFTLHVGILPPLVILLTVLHLTVFRRHGVTFSRSQVNLDEHGYPIPSARDGWFWPDQAFLDMLASLVIFGIMLGLVVYGHGHPVEARAEAAHDASLYEKWAHAGRDGRGANLDAPADPARPYPARPEWYFLSLFQLLKYFEGEQEQIGTVVIPQSILLLLAVLPLLGYGRMRRFGHVFGVLVVVGLLAAASTLTGLAIRADRADTPAARTLRAEQEVAEAMARRAVQLAQQGVPAEGAVLLLRRDPVTRGGELFQQACASCHAYGSDMRNAKATASDLHGFGSEDWIYRLLLDPGHADYFGRTRLNTMKDAMQEAFPSLYVAADQLTAEDRQEQEKAKQSLRTIARWLASHPRATSPGRDGDAFQEGLKTFRAQKCNGCHGYEGQGGTRKNKGPDLTGYGDPDWLRLMIMAPHGASRYSENNAMPVFRDLEGPTAELTRQEIANLRELQLKPGSKEEKDAARKQIEEATRLIHQSDIDRELIIRWMLNDRRAVLGGEPVTAPPQGTASR